MGPALSPIANGFRVLLLHQLYINLPVNPHSTFSSPTIIQQSIHPSMAKKSRSSYRKSLVHSSTITTNFHYNNSISPRSPLLENTVVIPIDTGEKQQPQTLSETESAAAVRIQSSYRAHLIRSLTATIRAVNSETEKLQRTIQQQDTVDAIRTSERERMRVSEALMRLLLKLDSVRGLDPAVRELRKRVSRKIVGLQEVVDAVAAEEDGCWEFVRSWEEDLAAIEGEVCRERGGGEMERFCVEKLGFVCFQRFLRGGA